MAMLSFGGIDVSKDRLDVVVLLHGRLMHALTNAMANDRRSTEGLSSMPDEWMQLIRLFSMTKAMP